MASKSMVAFLMVNLALFALVSAAPRPTTTSCPDLNVCADIAGSLRDVIPGRQSESQCCQRLASVVNGDAANCLCSILRTPAPGLEPSQGLGNIVGTALGLVNSIIGGFLGGFFGGYPKELPLDIVATELHAIFRVCGLDTPAHYDCPRLY
ncbi:hypothetical protein BVRB_5g102180 [Beta vulgaris subsp. vulgaris]|uniref:14 kDa proline-rich protein DC2.15-like n=1 Tax=Beta vulgaris subsp. vulgaris TaxID=3555 RepID=UPI00053F61FE|nr:14 kDa proline-rich protein DC2.15-like [Beta vulgaris subsp. vulgaris]KMT12277.1 hypothetical protein BVRB_5g102180 [Beta vulgaris subsp. vulgaris]